MQLPSGLRSVLHINKTYAENGADTSKINIAINLNGNTSTLYEDTQLGQNTSTSPEGRTANSDYNPTTGQAISSTVTGFARTDYSYDSRGRLSAVTTGDRQTDFTYNSDDSGKLSSITDAEGHSTAFNYDLLGRLTDTTYADGRVLTQSYDANGNLALLQPPGRPAHTFSYSGVDKTTGYTPPDVNGISNPVTEYNYDRDRRLTDINRPDGQALAFTYQSDSNLLASLSLPTGNYEYSYNSHAQLSQITHPTGDTLGYQYDGNLLTEVSWAGEVEGSVQYQYSSDFITNRYCINNNDCIDYSYDNDNLTLSAGDLSINRQAQQGGAISRISLNNISTAYTLNSYGELESTRSQHNSNDLYSVSYQRDLLGRITQKEETIVGNTTSHVYTYSDNGRLTQVETGSDTTQYSYDSNGNRTAKTNLNGTETGTYDDQDRLTTYNGCSYQYTDNGELQQKICGTDITNYRYDVLGNLLNVTLPDGTTMDYIIDGQDRRIGKKINGSLQQSWLYGDQLNPIAELDANNNIVAQFIYASQANVPDYMIKGGITYKIISDYLGSPRLVVNASNGSIAQQLDYDEFGQIINDTNPNFQPFGFAGGLYDGDTQLTRFGARDYDAEAGRWTNKDPIQFNGGDSNLYGYVLSDPINFVDPDGLRRVGQPGVPDPRGNVRENQAEFIAIAASDVGFAASALTVVCPVCGVVTIPLATGAVAVEILFTFVDDFERGSKKSVQKAAVSTLKKAIIRKLIKAGVPKEIAERLFVGVDTAKGIFERAERIVSGLEKKSC